MFAYGSILHIGKHDGLALTPTTCALPEHETYRIEIENSLEKVHGVFFFEPRSTGNKTVKNDNDAPQVQDAIVHRQLGSLMQRNQLRQGLAIEWCKSV